ncbi:hypothetical protein [Nonomuraea sp. B19D2]|uniref:hypothetical protein n=1 Tax=Nonomuraea sp. B19D2 TaxID=3159561 RepID=UPI0032DB036B
MMIRRRWTGEIPGVRQFLELRREGTTWALCEEIRAKVQVLQSHLNAREAMGVPPEQATLLNGARDQAKKALALLDDDIHRRGATVSHMIAAQLHLNRARSLWLRILSPEELNSYLPSTLSLVREHLSSKDPRRIALEGVARTKVDAGHQRSDGELVTIVEAVDAARDVALQERLRAASFARIVGWVITGLFCFVIAIAVLTALWPGAVPLCFNPTDQRITGQPGKENR